VRTRTCVTALDRQSRCTVRRCIPGQSRATPQCTPTLGTRGIISLCISIRSA